MVGVVVGIAAWAGRRGWQTALIGFLVMVSSPLYLVHEAQVMSDIPAALFTTLAAAVLLAEGWARWSPRASC